MGAEQEVCQSSERPSMGTSQRWAKGSHREGGPAEAVGAATSRIQGSTNEARVVGEPVAFGEAQSSCERRE